MSSQRAKLWNKLQQAGVVVGPMPESASLHTPWYIKLLLAISGWLAALFLLVFMGLAFELVFRSAVASVLVGSTMVGAAFALLRLPRNEFYEHIALAVSLAGQALVVYVIFDNVSVGVEWLLVFLFQLVMAVVMPNFIHRVISSYIAVSAFSMTLYSYGVPDIASSIVMVAAAWLWLYEFRYPKHMDRQRAIAYGLVLALIQVKGSALFGFSSLGGHLTKANLNLWVQPWMGDVLAGAVMLYVVWHILKRAGHSMSEPFALVALAGTFLLMLVSMEARGVSVGILILLLGFAGSNRVLMGLGILSLLFFISSYYYLLDATLLEKSKTLLQVGLVLLIARWGVLRMARDDTGAQHV